MLQKLYRFLGQKVWIRSQIRIQKDYSGSDQATKISDLTRNRIHNTALQETQKSKEKAITEIRCMVQEQDRLRREIQQYRYR
jgi:hypothetical protein